MEKYYLKGSIKMNKVFEIGRNTKDIDLRATASGTSVASFSIAVKRNFKNAQGEYDSDFFECIAFNKLAETISKYVKKGDLIGIEGRLQTRTYDDKEGKKHYITEIVVEGIEFLQQKKQEEPPKDKIEKVDPFDDIPF